MDIAIARAIAIAIVSSVCCTFCKNCAQIKEIVTKEIVNIKEEEDTENIKEENHLKNSNKQNTKPDSRATESRELTNDNALQEAILTNNIIYPESFFNDDYIRSEVYVIKRNYNQCHQTSSEKEKVQEKSVQTEEYFNDALFSNESQKQIPSSEISIDSSTSVPQFSKLPEVIRLRFVNSTESRNLHSQDIIENSDTNYISLPKKMRNEIENNVNYPLTSTKIRSKSSALCKLRNKCKRLTKRLNRIFNKNKNKRQ
ncbi:uncharacterized protein [Anoplolepis gracilipes]|uniref:uncharacterized protein n=1 Tax=Anoplolepis gracilipes TaxID=354296 RepID=UPI003B9F31AB